MLKGPGTIGERMRKKLVSLDSAVFFGFVTFTGLYLMLYVLHKCSVEVITLYSLFNIASR